MTPIYLTTLTNAAMPLAATEVASDAVYEFARLEWLSASPWWSIVLIGIVLMLLAYVWLFYRREARSISTGKALVLALLRTLALAGLVMFFLGLEKRSSMQLVEPSRVAVLVDTSLSMELADGQAGSDDSRSRAATVRQLLANSRLVGDLLEQHDVDLVSVGEVTQPVAYLKQDVIDSASGAKIPPSNAAETLDANNLANELATTGHETRLGDAIAATLERYRGLPLAGMVLLTDGGQNRGLELKAAAEAAAAAKVKLHAIGFGPTEAPANVAVRELLAPERAFPGDMLTLQAIVHAQDLSGQPIELQLSRRKASTTSNPDELGPEEFIESRTITAGSDDALETVRFETNPAEAGAYVYQVRAVALPREARTDDNQATAEVSVIDRQTRVLLFAGGPNRDYRFLRNQLQRDKSFVVDVLLASATVGVSQDANQILSEFPTSPQQLSEYDAIVAFDPDWSALSTDQVQWLEQWVAQQAGGLVVLPGRVNTPQWGLSTQMRTIRGLYPVRMPSQLLDLTTDDQGRDVARRVEFTRDGQEAEFLWLADSRSASEEAWQQFEGVYSALEHNGRKPGATVYANLAGADDQEGPAYIVGQYYGAGQVLYIGSSELWRLRKYDVEYYERLWTSLLRHTSQARLLQGSPRGKLLIAQDRYELGATIPIRAVMTNPQLQPLVADSLTLDVTLPSGQVQQMLLAADPQRAGNFAGELRVPIPGAYRLTLAVPESTDELQRSLRVAVPELEVGQATRDVAALRMLAEVTRGLYYANGQLAATGGEQLPSVAEATPSQARSKRVIGSVDKPFAQNQSLLLLTVVAGALSLEWILRRLSYLA